MRHLTIPNAMTTLRVLLAPVLAWLIFLDDRFWALTIFCIALATDAEGSVARYLHQESKFGATFDLVADGILLLGGIIPLLILQKVSWIPLLALALINIPRFIIAAMHKKRKGDFGSTFLSKATGVATLLIIPLAIVEFPYIDAYLWSTVIFTAAVLSVKTYSELRAAR